MEAIRPSRQTSMANRSVHELALSKALSRHVGYTTGAYDIFRIAEVTLLFEADVSRYQFQLVDQVVNNSPSNSIGVAQGYASGILDFGVGLGLLERLPHTGPPKLAKFKPTPSGLAYRAAHLLNLEEFKRFLLTALVVEHDADGYCLLLEVLLEIQPDDSPILVRRMFRDRLLEMLQERADWINRVFSTPVLRGRLVGWLPWAKLNPKKEIQVKKITENSARHHTTPRRGWAVDLGHYDDKAHLVTPDGLDLLARLRAHRSRFFWLGPEEGCQEALRIPEEDRLLGPFAPSWNVIRPLREGKNRAQLNKIRDSTVRYMLDAYPYMQLGRANQVPLDAVRPYIYYLEASTGVRTEDRAILRDIFLKHSDKFGVLSKRLGTLGYYQVKSKA